MGLDESDDLRREARIGRVDRVDLGHVTVVAEHDESRTPPRPAQGIFHQVRLPVEVGRVEFGNRVEGSPRFQCNK